jgi:hypothetical protein
MGDGWRAMLATRDRHGGLLLFDAFAWALRNVIASFAFIVDAKDDK